jgi:hypothetical protein
MPNLCRVPKLTASQTQRPFIRSSPDLGALHETWLQYSQNDEVMVKAAYGLQHTSAHSRHHRHKEVYRTAVRNPVRRRYELETSDYSKDRRTRVKSDLTTEAIGHIVGKRKDG